MSENKTSTVAELIPNAEAYFNNGFNVMLIGPHGTGKTAAIVDLCERLGIKFKYYSCSTLDPWTDFVGVPVPMKDNDGRDYLKMVRPHDLDQAELIFFDEFNRGDSKTMNAVFEIIQFGTINGEPLPNLKACWAAMNPPDEGYNVDVLDAALMDRFDLFIEVKPKPSVEYMAQFVPFQIATAAKMWWDGHERARRNDMKAEGESNIPYVSPRRLMKLVKVWTATKSGPAIKACFPPDQDINYNALISLLKNADENVENVEVDPTKFGQGEAAFEYNHLWLIENKDQVADFLKKNDQAFDTHKRVAEVFSTQIGGKNMVEYAAPVLDALNSAQLEAMVNKFPETKQTMMREAFADLYKTKPDEARKYQNLYKVLKANAKPGVLPEAL